MAILTKLKPKIMDFQHQMHLWINPRKPVTDSVASNTGVVDFMKCTWTLTKMKFYTWLLTIEMKWDYASDLNLDLTSISIKGNWCRPDVWLRSGFNASYANFDQMSYKLQKTDSDYPNYAYANLWD